MPGTGAIWGISDKYEKGTNRIAGGRLYSIAQALGVEVSFFYEGIGAQADAFESAPRQRLLLELTRNFTSITSRRQQEAICRLARTLASFEGDDELELVGAAVIEID